MKKLKTTDSGFYECETCGKKGEGYRKMQRHELLCGIDKISGYVEDVENIWNLDIPENPDSKTEDDTRQLQIGERFLGYCSKCDERIVSSDRLDERNLFECQKCGKINRFEN